MEFFLKAIIKDGSLVIPNNDQVADHLIKHEGKEVVISVTPYHKKASAKQIRWYWGIAIQAIINHHKETTGETIEPAEVHAYNMDKIVKPKIRTKEVMGSTIVQVDDFSLSKMNTKEFNVFKDNLQLFWSERDLIIPDPNQENFLNDERDKAFDSLKGSL